MRLLALFLICASAVFGQINPNTSPNPLPSTLYTTNPAGTGGLTQVATLPATCTPATSAPVQLTVSPFGIYVCTATNIWTPTGNGATISGTQVFNYIDPTSPAYGAKLDVKFYINGAFSFPLVAASSPVTVTCSSCTPAPAAADVGKKLQATSWNGNTGAYGSSTTLMPACSITSVVVGTSWTCASSGGNAASTGTGYLMVGTDDTAAWQAAYTAAALANVCLTIKANGYSFVNAPLFNTTPTCVPGWSTANTHYVGFSGGESSTLVFVPLSTMPLGSCPGTGSSYFFGFQGVTVEQIAVNGYGLNPGGTQACSVITSQIDGTYRDVVVAGWLNNTLTSVGFTFGSTTNAGAHVIENISVSCAGANSAVVTGNARNAMMNFFESCNANPPLTVNASAFYFAVTDDYQNDSTAASYIKNSGTFICQFCQTSSNTSTQSSVVSAQQGSYTLLDTWTNTTNNGNANSDIIASASGTGSTMILRGNKTMTGGANTTGRILFVGSANDKIYIGPDNTFASEIFASSGQVLAVASSAGTSAATIDTGSRNETGSFTLTGNATAASTTVTLTFVGVFSLNGNAPSCSLVLKNGTGTWAATASVIEGTTSTTSYAWVLNNQGTNLAASTYKGVWTCTPR